MNPQSGANRHVIKARRAAIEGDGHEAHQNLAGDTCDNRSGVDLRGRPSPEGRPRVVRGTEGKSLR